MWPTYCMILCVLYFIILTKSLTIYKDDPLIFIKIFCLSVPPFYGNNKFQKW